MQILTQYFSLSFSTVYKFHYDRVKRRHRFREMFPPVKLPSITLTKRYKAVLLSQRHVARSRLFDPFGSSFIAAFTVVTGSYMVMCNILRGNQNNSPNVFIMKTVYYLYRLRHPSDISNFMPMV